MTTAIITNLQPAPIAQLQRRDDTDSDNEAAL
jgi:hypothetical protein